MTNVEGRVSKVLAGQNESTQVSDIGEVEDDSRRRFRNNKKGESQKFLQDKEIVLYIALLWEKFHMSNAI